MNLETQSNNSIKKENTIVKEIKEKLRQHSDKEIMVMTYLLKLKMGGIFFDKSMESTIRIIESVTKHPLTNEPGEIDRFEVQRWLIARYALGFLKTAKTNSQHHSSLKGISWNLLASKAPKILSENGQKINKEWLFKTMGPLIKNNTNEEVIKAELNKFVIGNSNIVESLITETRKD